MTDQPHPLTYSQNHGCNIHLLFGKEMRSLKIYHISTWGNDRPHRASTWLFNQQRGKNTKPDNKLNFNSVKKRRSMFVYQGKQFQTQNLSYKKTY